MDTSRDGRIDYVELPANDLPATRSFFETVFGWTFQDWGPDYVGFKDGLMNGGFYKNDGVSRVESGGALVVLYHSDLEAVYEKVVAAGGTIGKEIFDFPGGRRFHFLEPSGSEFAIWSEQKAD